MTVNHFMVLSPWGWKYRSDTSARKDTSKSSMLLTAFEEVADCQHFPAVVCESARHEFDRAYRFVSAGVWSCVEAVMEDHDRARLDLTQRRTGDSIRVGVKDFERVTECTGDRQEMLVCRSA